MGGRQHRRNELIGSNGVVYIIDGVLVSSIGATVIDLDAANYSTSFFR
jgi:hypothetical protein